MNVSLPTTSLTSRQAWKALDAHGRTIRGVHLRTFFADNRYAANA